MKPERLKDKYGFEWIKNGDFYVRQKKIVNRWGSLVKNLIK